MDGTFCNGFYNIKNRPHFGPTTDCVCCVIITIFIAAIDKANGIKFKVTQLGFADGMELLTTLGRIIGLAINDPKKSASSAAIIGDIIGRLSYPELAAIMDKLAKTTRIEREPGRWPVLEPEVDLAGNYDLTLRWLKFALEVNYGDFFVAGGLLEGAINPAEANPA